MLFGTENNIDLREQSPISLAFVGDGVLELLVRERLVKTTRLLPNALHKTAVKYVSAHGQAKALIAIEPLLCEKELNVLHRGKNANKATVSKNATVAEYRASTGVEALFGYLYLSGDFLRVNELFDVLWDSVGEIG